MNGTDLLAEFRTTRAESAFSELVCRYTNLVFSVARRRTGELALAQAALYLACAPKSNAVYVAYNDARDFVRRDGSRPVPVHLRNAPTRLMKEMGLGAAYRYAHDEPDAYAAGEDYFPQGMPEVRFYSPSPRGMEEKIGEKLAHLRDMDAAAKKKP